MLPTALRKQAARPAAHRPHTIRGVKAILFSLPASHPSVTGRLMLERKGIEVTRIDLIPALHRLILKRFFGGGTVPAVVIDGQRFQGTRTISRALDALVPEPPLFPEDPERRAEVEQAELWGDLVFQSAARRLAWAALKRDHSTIRTLLEGASLPLPTSVAVATAPPLIWLSARANRADDRAVRRDLAALPGMLGRIDALIERGVIGGVDPNAADYQLATSVRLLMALDDLREDIEGRPCGRLALRLVPEPAGHIPRVFPSEWIR
jgi:glutathione S-transferase